MELCRMNRNYMIGEKSTFGSSQNGQNMPKKRSTRKNIFLYIKQLPTLLMKKSFTFYIPFKNLPFFKGNKEINRHFLPFVLF